MKNNLNIIFILFFLFFFLFFLFKDEISSNDLVSYQFLKAVGNVEFSQDDFSYKGRFSEVDDFYEIIFEVNNISSSDIRIVDCNYQEDNDYFHYYLFYENGTLLKEGDIIKKGESFIIRYGVSYQKILPSSISLDIDPGFNIIYEQIL